MRAAIYARVSSAAQRDQQTIRAQLDMLPGWCAAQGWTVVATFIDDGKTARAGQLAHRTALLELLDAAEAGRFDVVVVLDVDRLTRSEDHIERSYIVGRLQRAQVKIASPSSGLIDLDTFAGDVQIAISTASSADWLRRHCARIKAGKAAAIAAGRKPAGPTPYGLRYDRASHTWSVDPDEGAVIREIFRRVAAGETTTAIAEDLTARNVPRARSTVWLRERVWNLVVSATYRGVWTADKRKRLTVPVPRIVTDAQWFDAQARLIEHGKRGLRRTKRCYLVEGLVVCGLCGARVGIASASQRWEGRNGGKRGATPARYVCGHRRRPLRGAAPCTLPILTTDDVDGRLWAALARMIDTGDRLERAAAARQVDAGGDAQAWAADLESARARLGRLATTEAAILARFRRGAISPTALDVELAAITRERLLLERQVEAATRARTAATARSARASGLRAIIAELRARIATASPEQRRRLAEQLFSPGSITLQPDGRILATVRVRHVAFGSTSSDPATSLEFRLVA